ncbi:MAG: tRNA (adenosine(37)-N6)-threonylcarbamoyltransferase complex transferase subunit TsaD [Candidatus Gracilibacteria bacterium]|nr:tRNA (adenosine(37)-N6)-threonylcarbamoyltransferase complex transferase subunit TsaD [Candidatus Gracilibacteria bacterium]MDQ7023418.1 tRNA (adenosine(37)-N6)-threonylcarbamoyltransferase complex transferase subunit TsaD [Candidatus Gracilibacteria bacterium]
MKKEDKKIILAFETSCDDTSIAIFEDDKLLFMDTASQIKIHNITGGVVPEVAAREHANAIFGVLENVLTETNLKLENIDYIGVTTSPGLLPSLLTGTTVASTISTVLQIPIIPINHIQAHVFSNFLERKEEDIKFPLICLTVSGGHNDIYSMKDIWDLEKVGSTTDDSSGEAFDKVAKMMGLEYPGGPIISKLAESHPQPIPCKEGSKPLFPRVWLVKKEADFSFSGLKSAVKREVDKRTNRGEKELTLEDKIEISYEFQEAVIEVLAYKLVQVALQNGVKNVMLAGGVSANNRLKEEITRLAKKNNLEFIFPVSNLYCMDNAAMVGILTYYKIKYGEFEKKIGVVKL